jgi:hypothetical protein
MFSALTKSVSMYRMGMLLKIEIPFIAFSSGSLFCLNIAEKALPISQVPRRLEWIWL